MIVGSKDIKYIYPLLLCSLCGHNTRRGLSMSQKLMELGPHSRRVIHTTEILDTMAEQLSRMPPPPTDVWDTPARQPVRVVTVPPTLADMEALGSDEDWIRYDQPDGDVTAACIRATHSRTFTSHPYNPLLDFNCPICGRAEVLDCLKVEPTPHIKDCSVWCRRYNKYYTHARRYRFHIYVTAASINAGIAYNKAVHEFNYPTLKVMDTNSTTLQK
jgi:predicted RNA-binding Zn-ribbon protein involved in translation (DUF1610 family)